MSPSIGPAAFKFQESSLIFLRLTYNTAFAVRWFFYPNPHFSSPMRNALAEAVVQMGFFICPTGVVFCALLKCGRKTLDATPCVQSGFLIDSPNR